MWKKLSDTLIFIIVAIIGLVALIIFSPLLIFSLFSDHTANKRSEKVYLDYLLEIDGHKLFCYNNRKDCRNFIEQQVIPYLPADVKLIFLDGRYPNSDYSEKFASTVLYKIKNQVGFPYLLKVQWNCSREIS